MSFPTLILGLLSLTLLMMILGLIVDSLRKREEHVDRREFRAPHTGRASNAAITNP